MRRLAVLAVFFLLVLGLLLAYRFLVGGGRAPVQAPVNVSLPGGSVSVVDSDGDGIPDDLERVYGTDPYRPNYLLAYALGKLPVEEALLFKNVEDFNESSRGLVDLYASLPREKRGSIEVAMLLGQILSDNAVSEAERRLFEAKFVNPSRLEIVGLNWTPTRVVLDKIYDINVTFTARDDKTPIAYAELRFIPVEYYYMVEKYGMRPEDYPKVFPPDKERVYNLTPIDGKFDSLEENFSVQIKDIVGGREYKIVALVRDLAGNEKIEEVKTPYIRQFENVAKTDDLLIGVHYFAWYATNSWIRDTKKTTVHTPLLGMYTSEDPLIFDKHADWATGHGIDFFIIEWASPNDWTSKNLKDNILKNSYLLKSDQIKFCITYDLDVSSELGRLLKTNDGKGNNWFNYGFDMNNNYNVKIFLEDFSYFSQFFEHPQYLKIDGKPLVFIYGAMKLRNAESVISEVREKYNPILIGQLVAWYPQEEIKNRIVPLFPLFDGVYAYNMVGGDPGKGEDFIDYVAQQFSIFKEISERYNKFFIPHVEPGYNDSAIRNPYLIIERSPQFFKKYCQTSLRFLDPKLRMILVTSFNEWHEDQQIEPAVDYKDDPFIYLRVIKDYLVGKS
ncbi:MAG: glycoside hydrolase family 99-like domain-containing protein [Thermofilum sp.]|nr:glycoside hydrolase family 99-like domain-containing protein [Thermofilum sp.]